MDRTADEAMLRRIFSKPKTFAVVGFSANPSRASHFVAQFLQQKGFRIVPVNPGLAGQRILGEMVYPDLASIPDRVDVVDIFRQSEHVPALVEEALDHLPGLSAIWMQIGVQHEAAADRARQAGLDVVQNRCPKIEYPRLFA